MGDWGQQPLELAGAGVGGGGGGSAPQQGLDALDALGLAPTAYADVLNFFQQQQQQHQQHVLEHQQQQQQQQPQQQQQQPPGHSWHPALPPAQQQAQLPAVTCARKEEVQVRQRRAGAGARGEGCLGPPAGALHQDSSARIV
jgi:hypothetical protein